MIFPRLRHQSASTDAQVETEYYSLINGTEMRRRFRRDEGRLVGTTGVVVHAVSGGGGGGFVAFVGC